jgi:hypothetical protein
VREQIAVIDAATEPEVAAERHFKLMVSGRQIGNHSQLTSSQKTEAADGSPLMPACR